VLFARDSLSWESWGRCTSYSHTRSYLSKKRLHLVFTQSFLALVLRAHIYFSAHVVLTRVFIRALGLALTSSHAASTRGFIRACIHFSTYAAPTWDLPELILIRLFIRPHICTLLELIFIWIFIWAHIHTLPLELIFISAYTAPIRELTFTRVFLRAYIYTFVHSSSFYSTRFSYRAQTLISLIPVHVAPSHVSIFWRTFYIWH